METLERVLPGASARAVARGDRDLGRPVRYADATAAAIRAEIAAYQREHQDLDVAIWTFGRDPTDEEAQPGWEARRAAESLIEVLSEYVLYGKDPVAALHRKAANTRPEYADQKRGSERAAESLSARLAGLPVEPEPAHSRTPVRGPRVARLLSARALAEAYDPGVLGCALHTRLAAEGSRTFANAVAAVLQLGAVVKDDAAVAARAGGALREAGIDPIQGGDTGSAVATLSLVSADLLRRLLALHRVSFDGVELVEITAGNAAGTGVRLLFEPRSPLAARWRPPHGYEGGQALADVLDELDRRANPEADGARSKAEWLAAAQVELDAAREAERADVTDLALARLAAVALLALRTRARTEARRG
jgi:hypothetical protein